MIARKPWCFSEVSLKMAGEADNHRQRDMTARKCKTKGANEIKFIFSFYLNVSNNGLRSNAKSVYLFAHKSTAGPPGSVVPMYSVHKNVEVCGEHALTEMALYISTLKFNSFSDRLWFHFGLFKSLIASPVYTAL